MARKTAANLKRGRAASVAARINAQMKRPVIHMASDERYTVERVPTGSLVIDRLTGGGFARGRHVELYGDWTVGKSLIAYMTMILAQQRGEVCAVLDPERIFNSAWFTELGGSVEDLLMPDMTNANEMGNVLRLMEQSDEDSPAVDIVLIDSVASLLTREEQRYDWESESDPRTASLARFMSILLRQITMGNDKTLFLWTNQWRDKIGPVPSKSTPGGRALGFYASTRVELMKGERETEARKMVLKGKEVERKVAAGQWVNVRLTKEKTGARPDSVSAFMLDWDTGRIDQAREIIDLGMQDGLIERAGDRYLVSVAADANSRKSYHGIKRALAAINGDEEVREFLTLCIQEQTADMGADE